MSELLKCKCNKPNIKLCHNINHIISKCKSCLKRSNHSISLLKDEFKCTYNLAKKYSNESSVLDKFILLLRKGVYPYEYTDSFDKYNETQYL